jgi:hypothetical protein
MGIYSLEDVESIETAASSSNPTTDTVDEAPKRRRGRPKGSTNKSSVLPVQHIEDGVTQLLTLMSLGVSMIDTYDGSVLLTSAPNVGKSIATLAAKDKKVQETLTKFLRAGSWAAVISSGLPIVMAVGANHGFLPANDITLMDTGVEPTIYRRARESVPEQEEMTYPGPEVGSNVDVNVGETEDNIVLRTLGGNNRGDIRDMFPGPGVPSEGANPFQS